MACTLTTLTALTSDRSAPPVTRLPCVSGGQVLVSDLRAALNPDTCLVSVMHANNETGVLNDIQALARWVPPVMMLDVGAEGLSVFVE